MISILLVLLRIPRKHVGSVGHLLDLRLQDLAFGRYVNQTNRFGPLPVTKQMEEPPDHVARVIATIGQALVGHIDASLGHQNGPREATQVAQNVAIKALRFGPQLDSPQSHAKGLKTEKSIKCSSILISVKHSSSVYYFSGYC